MQKKKKKKKMRRLKPTYTQRCKSAETAKRMVYTGGACWPGHDKRKEKVTKKSRCWRIVPRMCEE
jgi:hypothetical protein